MFFVFCFCVCLLFLLICFRSFRRVFFLDWRGKQCAFDLRYLFFELFRLISKMELFFWIQHMVSTVFLPRVRTGF